MSEFGRRRQEVLERISAAAHLVGRAPESIKLIAVSKKFPVERIEEALRAGQSFFGENYVQEATAKHAVFQEDKIARKPRFHLIGPLQRNKVKHALRCFEMIETVDRLSLAQSISTQAERENLKCSVLIQVNTSGEETKSGVFPDQVATLCQQVLALPGMRLQGLMTIGKGYGLTEPASVRGQDFRLLRELRDDTADKLGCLLPELSMGMSGDYELAVEEGATIVRVGSALFGPRPDG